MFALIEKIDKAAEKKARCTVIDKSGKYLRGTLEDSWVRLSGGKMRGKIVFRSDEKGEIQIDVNDILDIVPS